MKLMTIITVLIILAFSISAGHLQPAHNDDDPLKVLQVLVNSTCDGNVVSVTAGGENVTGAHVSVKDVSTADLLATGDTGDDGLFVFEACDAEVDVKVAIFDYPSQTVTTELVGCGQCGAPQPQCTGDTQCPADKICVNDECAAIECACGKVENHQCVKYACCQDSQCLSTQSCVNHSCQQKPPEENGCRSNLSCPQTQYCDMPAGKNTGTCKDVTAGSCGQVSNHSFAAYGYECGSEAGCPSCQQGYDCVGHKCVQGEVTCPAEGVVGANQTCGATENGQPCANCGYIVTDPSGKNSTGTTDQNGSFTLPLSLQGTYKVALLKDGRTMKIIEVKSMPKAQGGDAGKPTAAGGDMTPIIGGILLLLLLAAAFYLFFLRERAAKK